MADLKIAETMVRSMLKNNIRDANPTEDDNKVFNSEFYDNAPYNVIENGQVVATSSYNPLSQSSANGNNTTIVVGSDGKFPEPFTFASIKAPETPADNKPNDFRFQCYNTLKEEGDFFEKLLVIKNFDISVQVQ